MPLQDYLGRGWEANAGADLQCFLTQPGQPHEGEVAPIERLKTDNLGGEDVTLFRCGFCGRQWWEQGDKEEHEYLSLEDDQGYRYRVHKSEVDS